MMTTESHREKIKRRKVAHQKIHDMTDKTSESEECVDFNGLKLKIKQRNDFLDDLFIHCQEFQGFFESNLKQLLAEPKDQDLLDLFPFISNHASNYFGEMLTEEVQRSECLQMLKEGLKNIDEIKSKLSLLEDINASQRHLELEELMTTFSKDVAACY